jgi:hypothetical protein|eukprot:COSAG06_NODE_32_length_31260_cov_54.706973_10_plen_56_part_00
MFSVSERLFDSSSATPLQPSFATGPRPLPSPRPDQGGSEERAHPHMKVVARALEI